MIKKANDIKLYAKPVTLGAEHLYFYEGPCRFGSGEALQPGYDRLANAQKAKAFLDSLKEIAPYGVELMEPLALARTDDWDNKDEMWEKALAAIQDADVLVIQAGLGSDDLVLELIERSGKPAIFDPHGLSGIADTAALRSKPEKKHIVYGTMSWDHAAELLSAFRAAKVIRSTSILLATRFGSTTSFSSVDSFNNYDLITSRLGVHFRFVNIHELLDQMSPAVEGGNHTTPGRITPDLTDEDMEAVNALADELIAGAAEVQIDRQYLVNSLIAYITVRKNMELKDCNAFAVPCPDVCSTRRINEMKFTFCLTHSLNMEQGIPSACEFDVSGALSQQALAAVSQKSPYMGNAYPIKTDKNGNITMQRVSETELAEFQKQLDSFENLYGVGHSVAHRRLADTVKNSPYALRHFAFDQKFGAIIRYDFNADKGKTITLCRFSPDGSKLFIGRGTIVGGLAYDSDNCSNPVIFRVDNKKDFFEKQCQCGMHLPLVYGDYTEELIAFAKILGVEPLVSV